MEPLPRELNPDLMSEKVRLAPKSRNCTQIFMSAIVFARGIIELVYLSHIRPCFLGNI